MTDRSRLQYVFRLRYSVTFKTYIAPYSRLESMHAMQILLSSVGIPLQHRG